MPNSARKQPAPKSDDDSSDNSSADESAHPPAKSRKGLIKDEFDTDCWEPSLKDRLRRATGRDKP
ncbi:MAG: hypothetical protein ACR2QV_07330 [Gammaproteobacteria bacterium]